MIRRAFRDPLAHFLVAGAALWLLLAWRGEPADPASRTIVVSRERQAALAVNFEQLMGRSPTEREQAGLVANDVREEILAREALRLGLDQDDPVIRRRLARKMDDLATAEAEGAMPSDTELARWLAAHPERFGGAARVSFAQVSFATEAEARAALASGRPARGAPLDLPAAMTERTLSEVRERFGIQFAQGLGALAPAPGWQGPLPSGLGWHLVRLDRREAGPPAALAEVRAQVLDDWRGATMQARREAAYALLESGYTVRVAR